MKVAENFEGFDSCWNHVDFMLSVAKRLDIPVCVGNYVWSSGPSYESGLEVRFGQKIGGACIGMSTVPEVLIAKSIGLDVFGLSFVTNLGTGLSKLKLSHEEVMDIAEKASIQYKKLLKNILQEIPLPKTRINNMSVDVTIANRTLRSFPYEGLSSAVKSASTYVLEHLLLNKNSPPYNAIITGGVNLQDDKNDPTLVSIWLKDIPFFPLKSKGLGDSGYIATSSNKNGRFCDTLLIQTGVTGLTIVESTFLSLVLNDLRIYNVILLVSGSLLDEKDPLVDKIGLIGDYLNFTSFNKPLKILSQICPPHSHGGPIIDTQKLSMFLSPSSFGSNDQIVSSSHNELQQEGRDFYKIMGYYSSVFPTHAEREFAKKLGMDGVCITSMVPLYTLQYLGIQVVPLCLFNQHHDKMLNAAVDVQHQKSPLFVPGLAIKKCDAILGIFRIHHLLKKHSQPPLKLITLPESVQKEERSAMDYKKAVQFIQKTFFDGETSVSVSIVVIDYNLDLFIPEMGLSNHDKLKEGMGEIDIAAGDDIKVIKEVLLKDIPELNYMGTNKNLAKLQLCSLKQPKREEKNKELSSQFFLVTGVNCVPFDPISATEIPLLIRAFKMFGAKKLLLVSSLLSLNAVHDHNHQKPSPAIGIVNDILNFTGRNPLIGKNLDEFGPRFPDMSEPFSLDMNKKLLDFYQSIGTNREKSHIENDNEDLLLKTVNMFCVNQKNIFYTKQEAIIAKDLGNCDVINDVMVAEVITARHSGLSITAMGPIIVQNQQQILTQKSRDVLLKLSKFFIFSNFDANSSSKKKK